MKNTLIILKTKKLNFYKIKLTYKAKKTINYINYQKLIFLDLKNKNLILTIII